MGMQHRVDSCSQNEVYYASVRMRHKAYGTSFVSHSFVRSFVHSVNTCFCEPGEFQLLKVVL